MNQIETLLDTLMLTLKSGLPGVRIKRCFPAGKREAPLLSSFVTVGLRSVEARESSLGGGFGGRVEITVALDVTTPGAQEGAACSRLACELCDLLFFREAPLNLRQFSIGAVEYRRDLNAFYVQCTARFTMLAQAEGTAQQIERVLVRKGEIS